MKKHILVISQYFYPEQFRINDICEEWINRGYKVTVLTGIPNYPQGKFYDGYGLFKKKREVYKGIKIIRIPLIPRGKNSIMLALNYISFVVSGFFWNLFSSVKADCVFIFEVSPMSQALPGVWFAKRKKIPCYIYVQDLWPENFELLSGIKNKFIIDVVGKMVDYIYKNCTKIFTTSRSFITSICNRGVPKEKIEYWPQYAEDFYIPQKESFVDEIPNDNAFNLIFTGNIGASQGLEILPRVAVILKEQNLNRKIRFNIVGDGRYKETLIKTVKSYNVSDMFNFIPKQPATRIPQFIGACDAALLCLSDSPLFSKTIPAKLQSYMACGISIVASANGEIKQIIKESNAGLCSPAGNVSQLAKAIIELSKKPKGILEEMGSNARIYYEKNFNKKDLLNRMDVYLKHEFISEGK